MKAEPTDHGLFGPGSVTWRVHSNPVMLVGGLRALLIQALHPLAMAGVVHYSDFRSDPLRRLRNTALYVDAVTFGDTEEAHAAAAHVRRLHSKVKGTDPVTGREYSAEDPETLLWVHTVEVHSFLAAFRAYGGPIGDRDQDAYLAEQVAAAELIGIPRQMVPADRAGYREYFASMLPKLCSSRDAAAAIAFVRRPEFPPGSTPLRPLAPALRPLGTAAVALVPRSLRPIAGLPDPSPRDIPAAASIAFAARLLVTARAVGPLGDLVEWPLQKVLGVERREIAA